MTQSSGRKGDNAGDLELSWIRELAGILHETGLTEIEIEKADVRLRVSRAAPQLSAAVAAAPAPVAVAPAAAPAAPASPAAAPADLAGAVTSPMVGTVYLASAPGAPPFAKEGDSVKEGQTLMIIEAMKTMNPVAAPRAGVVKRVLVRDAQPVEYGEALIVVE